MSEFLNGCIIAIILYAGKTLITLVMKSRNFKKPVENIRVQNIFFKISDTRPNSGCNPEILHRKRNPQTGVCAETRAQRIVERC